jgi:hypothetical protein
VSTLGRRDQDDAIDGDDELKGASWAVVGFGESEISWFDRGCRAGELNEFPESCSLEVLAFSFPSGVSV